VLQAHFLAERQHKLARRAWEAWGLAIYLKKITVIRQLLEYYRKKKLKTLEEHHEALARSLRLRHENEAAELRRRYAALTRLEKREDKSVEQQYGAARAGQFYTGRPEDIGSKSDRFAGLLSSRVRAEYHGNAADICSAPARVSKNHINREKAAVITAPPPSPRALFRDNASDVTSGASLAYKMFRQNAADVTRPDAAARRAAKRLRKSGNRGYNLSIGPPL
jgi:hypothetical protein